MFLFSFISKSSQTTLGELSSARTKTANRVSEKTFSQLNIESTHHVTYISMSH